MPDKKHKITSICEFTKKENNDISLKEIFAYKVKEILDNGEVNGEYSLFNYVPRAYKKIKQKNIDIVDDIFKK